MSQNMKYDNKIESLENLVEKYKNKMKDLILAYEQLKKQKEHVCSSCKLSNIHEDQLITSNDFVNLNDENSLKERIFYLEKSLNSILSQKKYMENDLNRKNQNLITQINHLKAQIDIKSNTSSSQNELDIQKDYRIEYLENQLNQALSLINKYRNECTQNLQNTNIKHTLVPNANDKDTQHNEKFQNTSVIVNELSTMQTELLNQQIINKCSIIEKLEQLIKESSQKHSLKINEMQSVIDNLTKNCDSLEDRLQKANNPIISTKSNSCCEIERNDFKNLKLDDNFFKSFKNIYETEISENNTIELDDISSSINPFHITIDNEERSYLLNEQLKFLKSELQRFESNENRLHENMEYLKNLIYSFLINKNEKNAANMVNAICTILHFSAEEIRKVRSIWTFNS